MSYEYDPTRIKTHDSRLTIHEIVSGIGKTKGGVWF